MASSSGLALGHKQRMFCEFTTVFEGLSSRAHANQSPTAHPRALYYLHLSSSDVYIAYESTNDLGGLVPSQRIPRPRSHKTKVERSKPCGVQWVAIESERSKLCDRKPWRAEAANQPLASQWVQVRHRATSPQNHTTSFLDHCRIALICLFYSALSLSVFFPNFYFINRPNI